MVTKISKRPILLTIVCIVGYIWVMVSVPGVFSPSVKIASSVIELTVQMAVSHPQIYRDNWLLAII
jgi:hypothetical protein